MNPNYAALSASDGAGEPVRATVQSPGRSIGSTSIPVNATTNWPTGAFIATTGTLLANGTLNPTTVQVFYGTASGTTVTITSFAAGYTDKGNSAGDVVVIKPSTEWANLVANGMQGQTQFPAEFSNFIESAGGVWSQTTGLSGAQTSGHAWYQGVRYSIPAVTSETFTASKDTYVDVNPSTGAYTYVPVANFAAEPALTASCVRVAKVVTGASAITTIIQGVYNTPLTARTVGLNTKFRVYLNSAQNTSTSFAPVNFDTIVFDSGNNVDVVTHKGRFNVPVSGFYSFEAAMNVVLAGASNLQLVLFRNGLESTGAELDSISTTAASSTYGRTLSGSSGLMQLTAGDYIEIYQICNGTTAITTGSPYTWFSGELRSLT